MLYLCEEYDRLSVVFRVPFIRFAGKAASDPIKWMVSKEDKYTAAGVEHLARIRVDWEKTRLSISQMEEYAQELKQMADVRAAYGSGVFGAHAGQQPFCDHKYV